MENSKIGTKEAISLILTVGIVHTIISTPRDLLASMKSAVLINIVYVTIILFAIASLIVKLLKKFPGSDILDISEYLGGKKFKKILGILFVSYFIISSSFLLKEFSEALRTIYYPMTNIFFIMLLFIICIAITNKLELTAIVKANLLIVPIVIISSIFLFASNLRNFSFERIFPILGDGFINTFIFGIGNISSFTGIAFLYFLPPLLKEPNKLKKISIVSILIFFVYIFLNVAVILFMFSFLMSENEILTLYSASRHIEIGSFFVRLESLFLLLWLEIFACYFSIVAKASSYILKKITNIKDSKIFAYPISILIFSIALIEGNYATTKKFIVEIYPNILNGFNYIFCILLLIFANLKKNKESRIPNAQIK